MVFYFLFLMFAFVDSAFPQTNPAWEAEWNKTVEAAKREGQVNLYIFGGQSALPIEAGVFQKRFPEIRVVTVSGDPVPRILAERRAGHADAGRRAPRVRAGERGERAADVP